MILTIHCIIVEDEPLAQEILQDYIAMSSDLHLDGIAATPEQMQQLLKLRPQIALLDLSIVRKMKADGIDFWPTDTVEPVVIITTAYHQYDLTDMPFKVAAFLRKPILFDLFAQAVERARQQLNAGNLRNP